MLGLLSSWEDTPRSGRERSASGDGEMGSRQIGQSVGEWVIGGVKVARWCVK